MKDFDNLFLTESIQLIAGTDEAGRGPLAGPVVAAAAMFSRECIIPGVNDSKKLTPCQREDLYEKIIENALSYSVSIVDHSCIDEINILQASLQAMKQACESLSIKPQIVLVDGNKVFKSDIKCKAIVKGDSCSFSIAAASILAKVTRDRLMIELSEIYPQYKWNKNKGYPTKEHIEAIKKYGPSPYHRKTFMKKLMVYG